MAGGNRGNNQPANLPSLTPEVMQQLAQNQARELQIRAEELQLKKQQDQHGYSYAQEALKVQAADRADERREWARSRKHTFAFVIIMVGVVLAFLGFLVAIDKDAVALELIKAAVYLGGGGFAGFYYGKTKGRTEE